MRRIFPAVLLLAAFLLLSACTVSSSDPLNTRTGGAEKTAAVKTNPETDVKQTAEPVKTNPGTGVKQTAEPVSFTSDISDPFGDSDKDVDYKGYFRIINRYQGTDDEFKQGNYYLIVKNNTKKALYIEALITAKDKSGAILKREKAWYDCVGPGETAFDYVIFDAQYADLFDNEYPGPTNADDIASIDVDLQYIPNSEIVGIGLESRYIPIVSDLEVKKYENKDKRNVVITAKNHGKTNAHMPEAYVLFFDENDELIDVNNVYFADEDLELKSGDVLFGTAEIILNDYDHTELYVNGHSEGSTKKHTALVTKEDIEIVKEINIAYHGPNVNTRILRNLIIKNNSATPVEIECNSIVWNKDLHALETGSDTIEILGPGQTSICSLLYSNVLPDEVDHCDDTFFFKTDELNYEDVLHSLTYTTEKSGNGVILSVTNNGKKAACSVEAYVFFYDSSKTLVGAETVYVTDDDLEIKPGATESKKIENRYGTAFDYVEVFLKAKSNFISISDQ